MLSVAAHTAIVAAALYATAQARVTPPRPDPTIPRIYFPRLPQSPQHSAPTVRAASTHPRIPHKLVFVDPVDIQIPSQLDLTEMTTKPGDFPPAGTSHPVAVLSEGIASGDRATVLTADQVEKQAALAPGSSPPRYPEVLRNAGIEGRVLAVFVVDEMGRAEEASIRFTRSTNRLFEDAVRSALRRMRFIPAEIGGRKVRQLVQMPFVFTLSR